MSVLVFADNHQGKFAKSSLEAVSYARKIADQTGTEVIVLICGELAADGGLGNAGAHKVWQASVSDTSDSRQMTRLVVAAAEKAAADVVVFAHDAEGKLIAPRVAIRLNAGIVPGAVSLPETGSGFIIKKNVFSGKAIAYLNIKTPKKVITLLPNSFGVSAHGTNAEVVPFASETGQSDVKILEIKKESRQGLPLPEADIVVSAGRGMKGPENWGMIEELARLLGGSTACSRPVADIGWRPHHEHVGQTGLTIRPTLYIAVGISGAIQHLAGVNGSKVIVVINKDAEAPFFKAADYGIIGDAFEVLPRLIDAAKQFNASK